MKALCMIVLWLLPWSARRWCLMRFLGFELHPSARIGFSLVLPKRLIMGEGSRIGHLNICKGLELLEMEERSSIGNLNWITGFPKGHSRHFSHQPDRSPQLVLQRHSAVTNRHLIDCTASVTVGRFSIVGGFASQILTHSVDIAAGRQSSAPVVFGAYTFVSTNCVILGGSTLPDYSVLGAKSLLNKQFAESYSLYGGVPARLVKALPRESQYFTRSDGYVW